jgi:hypothetical protein
MGALYLLDDKLAYPLQAADLLAGQIRMAAEYEWGKVPSPLGVLRVGVNRYWVNPIDEVAVRTFLTMANISISTRRLKAIKERAND